MSSGVAPDPGPRHSSTGAQIEELATGAGGRAALRSLWRSERSRRLLLLDTMMDLLRARPGASSPLPPVQRAWDLLCAAQRERPDLVDEVVLLPETGLWLGRLLRRLSTTRPRHRPLWSEIGHFHAVAAVAAARAGLDFSFPVPMGAGDVCLPGLGRARLPAPRSWHTAQMLSRHGRLSVSSPWGVVRVPRLYDRPEHGWLPIRRVRLAQASGTSVALDDMSDYRIMTSCRVRPEPLPEAAVGRWTVRLQEAHALLVRVDEPSAIAMSELLHTLEPLPVPEPPRVRSASSAHGVGSAAVSEPPDAPACAAAVVHEVQHSKLSALMHLFPLDEVAHGVLHYAPWRDDPRPLQGMLQGAYAFTGVARFWRGCVLSEEEPERSAAGFEFALWRNQLARTLPALAQDPALTAFGRRVLRALGATVAGWRADPLPPGTGRLGRQLARDHRTQWRLHHLAPPPEEVKAWVAAWQGPHDDRPPTDLSLRSPGHPRWPRIEPNPQARGLDARADLVRAHLRDRAGFAPSRGAERYPVTDGARNGDSHWIAGETDDALRCYVQRITVGEGLEPPGAVAAAWSGLRLVLEDSGRDPSAAFALRVRPELVHAVHRTVWAQTGHPPDPLALARWLGRRAAR